VRFLADENFPHGSIWYLESLGHDLDFIPGRLPPVDDADVLAKAVDSQRVLLTLDADFGTLVFRERLPHPPAVILFRLGTFAPLEPAKIIEELIADDDIVIEGWFTTIEMSGIRQRPFPPTI
jgi:predicted nuclease of predicted toxin-antitoxin system